MKWLGRDESDNVEDGNGGGGAGGFALGGIGTIIVAIIAILLGKNPLTLISQIQSSGSPTEQSSSMPHNMETESLQRRFIGVVLKDTEKVWDSLFTTMNKTYEKPKLYLFSDQVRSACGIANTSAGPFYCPGDRKVYLDSAFFEELSTRFGSPGDLAKTYVIAHEVGHHVQNLLGITHKMEEQRQRLTETEFNKLSVKLELQADFLAGLFIHYDDQMNHILETGDIESALSAANAVGDDHLQKQMQGYVNPDSFTHGSSEQRKYWFTKGYKTGDIQQGDTFSADTSEK
jgi:predicted metalloprotease